MAPTRQTFGGFLPADTSSGTCTRHAGAAALSTGRGALAVALRSARPRQVHLPDYLCGYVFDTLVANGATPCPYTLSDALLPAALPEPAAGDMLLLVNYFGVRENEIAALAGQWPGPCLIDNTQAFFSPPVPGSWTFYSARKFFGVPDGAWLYAPPAVAFDITGLPVADANGDYLDVAASGDHPTAWRMYQAREAAIDCLPRRMSDFSRERMPRIACEAARARRVANASRLHTHFHADNLLPNACPPGAAPLCYPLLLPAAVSREKLAAAGLFVPVFWQEVAASPGSAHTRAGALARNLLPLPVDQRYGVADIDELALRLRRILATDACSDGRPDDSAAR